VILGLWRASRRSDVVVSGSEVGYGVVLGLPIARLARRRFVVLVQSCLDSAVEQWHPAVLRRFLLAAHRHVDLAVCVSPGLVDGVVANGLPREKVLVVDVGIDVDDVIRRGRAGVVARADEVGGRPAVVAAGRLCHQKGFDVLLRAHALVRAQGLDHLLRLIGDGPEHAALVDLADRLGVADSVAFVGFVADAQPWISAADLFVLSSRYEGMGGLVLLEALAHGVPVIASDCPTGPRRVLRDGALGALVPVEDVDALAAAIAAHLRDPLPLQARAQAGPARARDFDAAEAADQLAQIVDTVAGGRPARRLRVSRRGGASAA
jgi:glycosyltransferase involved in cell wall biosynthesis